MSISRFATGTGCAALVPLLLAGCVASAPSGSPNAQLRASQERALQRAGVSGACIAELDTSELTQVKGITDTGPKTSREVLIQRQRIRTIAAKACGTV